MNKYDGDLYIVKDEYQTICKKNKTEKYKPPRLRTVDR